MDAHGKGSTTCNLTSRELGLEEEYVAVLTAQRDAEMFLSPLHQCFPHGSFQPEFPHHDGPSTEKRLLPDDRPVL